jgi:hypothetical protein
LLASPASGAVTQRASVEQAVASGGKGGRGTTCTVRLQPLRGDSRDVCLRDQLHAAAGGLDLRLGQLGHKLGADDDRLLGQLALSENLKRAEGTRAARGVSVGVHVASGAEVDADASAVHARVRSSHARAPTD